MKNRKMKIYLSGPISEIIEKDCLATAKRIFKQAENKLRRWGYEVENPMENGLPTYATWEQHMEVDIKMLLRCDIICFLHTCDLYPSDGVIVEKIYARKKGLREVREVIDETGISFYNYQLDETLKL